MKLWTHKRLLKKTTAAKYALWRRIARRGCEGLSYALEDIKEMDAADSRGQRADGSKLQSADFEEMKSRNGFAYGKWLRDLTVSMIVEDINTGLAQKAEFLDTALERLHNRAFLSKIMPVPYMKDSIRMLAMSKGTQ
jgi:hypothetical protein